MTRWVVENLGPDVPLHFTAFHPDWKMLDMPPTPPATLTRARAIALENGVRYAYTGNVHDEDGGSTYCHGCGALLIGRDWYELGDWNLTDEGAARVAARLRRRVRRRAGRRGGAAACRCGCGRSLSGLLHTRSRDYGIFGVVDHAGDIDNHDRLVADHPGVVAGRQQRDIAGAELVLAAVVHAHPEAAGYVILEMRRLAALGTGDVLDVRRPAPAGLEGGATEGDAAERHQLHLAFVE